jgi:hypothetical protein
MKILFNSISDPWNNKYSKLSRNGSIIKYIQTIQSDDTLAIPWGDGLLEKNENDYQGFDKNIYLGILCSRMPFSVNNKLVYLPLDDDIFEFGLRSNLI